MGIFGFIRNLRHRQQAKTTAKMDEIELGERVSPDLLTDYEEPEAWGRLNPYQLDQLLRAKRAKNAS